MNALKAETIEDADRLAALAPAWWRLWRRAPEATPFQSPAWLLPWWRAFAPGRLRVVAVHEGENLLALAPLYLEEGAFGRRLLPIGISLSDYLDVLVDPDAAGAGDALAAQLGAMSDWEACAFEELAPGAAALSLPCPAGCTSEEAGQSACPVLALPAGDDPLRQAVPSGKLRKLRMAQNRSARREASVRRVEAAEAKSFLDDLFRLHGARWQERGEAGVLSDEIVRAFHEAALPGLVEADLARLYCMEIGSQVVGAYYGFHHGERVFAYLGGFNPDFAFESPGTMLMGHAIAEAAREGAREFHFLRGQERYKYEWGAKDCWNRRRIFTRAVPP